MKFLHSDVSRKDRSEAWNGAATARGAPADGNDTRSAAINQWFTPYMLPPVVELRKAHRARVDWPGRRQEYARYGDDVQNP